MITQKIDIFQSSSSTSEAFIGYMLDVIRKSDPAYASLASLDNLHLAISNSDQGLLRGTDQATEFHKAIYASFDDPSYPSTLFYNQYKLLCRRILSRLKVKTQFFGLWAIQRFPTIRFQFPGNVSVFEFHRDSDYSHPLAEINCFYAVNACVDSCALHVERTLGFGDYAPLNLQQGEYALLNTSVFSHGDMVSDVSYTRVSLDFRFVPANLLDASKSSLTTNKSFTTDSYFIDEKSMFFSP